MSNSGRHVERYNSLPVATEEACCGTFITRLHRKPSITFPCHCLGRPSFRVATPNQSSVGRAAGLIAVTPAKLRLRPCRCHCPALIYDAHRSRIAADPRQKVLIIATDVRAGGRLSAGDPWKSTHLVGSAGGEPRGPRAAAASRPPARPPAVQFHGNALATEKRPDNVATRQLSLCGSAICQV